MSVNRALTPPLGLHLGEAPTFSQDAIMWLPAVFAPRRGPQGRHGFNFAFGSGRRQECELGTGSEDSF